MRFTISRTVLVKISVSSNTADRWKCHCYSWPTQLFSVRWKKKNINVCEKENCSLIDFSDKMMLMIDFSAFAGITFALAIPNQCVENVIRNCISIQSRVFALFRIWPTVHQIRQNIQHQKFQMNRALVAPLMVLIHIHRIVKRISFALMDDPMNSLARLDYILTNVQASAIFRMW